MADESNQPAGQEDRPEDSNSPEPTEEDILNLWGFSPYTLERSPFSAASQTSSGHGPDSRHSSVTSGSQHRLSLSESTGNDGTPPVISLPPISYRTTFTQSGPSMWADIPSEEEEEEETISPKPRSWRDRRTLFGKVLFVASVKPSQSFLFQENRKQIKNAVQIVEQVTSVPLSVGWQRFTQCFFIFIFFANIIAAIYDIVQGPTHLNFKVSSLVIGCLENIIIVVMALVFFFLRKTASNTTIKRQQYIENILHEVLLYPILIMSVLGFVTEKMYQAPSGIFGWVQIALLIIDALELLWTQCVRMYMLYKLMTDLYDILFPGQQMGCSQLTFAGAILPRAFVTVVGNTVLFFFLVYMMGAQMDRENLVPQDYRVQTNATFLITSLIIFPLYNLALFVATSAYWVLETLILVNLKVSQDADFQSKLESDYGVTMSDAITFAVTKSAQTQKRLDNIRNMSTIKKVFYGLSEPLIFLALVLWLFFYAVGLYSFQAFLNPAWEFWVRLGFTLITLLANPHLFLLTLTVIILTPIFVIGLIFYPCSLCMCFWARTNIKQQQTTNVAQP